MSAPALQLAWRRRMLVVRSVTISLVAITYLASNLHSGTAQHAPRVLVLLALACLPNLLVWLQPGASRLWQGRWLGVELSADVVLFLALLHALGGADNPVAFYLLVPVLVAALSSPWLLSLALWLVSVIGWGGLLQWRLAPAPGSAHEHLAGSVHPVHSLGMWVIFCILGLVLVALGQHIQRQARGESRRKAVALELALQRERMYQLAARQAHLAHEISTPLNSLQWLLDDLEQADHPDARAQALQQLRQCGERLHAALREPLRPDGIAQVKASPLSDHIARAAERGALLRPGLKVTFTGPLDPWLGDEESWQRVFLNLVYNACDAGANRIDVRCERHGDCVLIQMADNGPGSSGTATAEGLGVGLALVETALAMHDGSLERLDNGQWTVARIRLPNTACERLEDDEAPADR